MTSTTPLLLMSASSLDSGKSYHKECTGLALETVKQHLKDEDITLFGSCFCPFVQRVWAAFEYLGIPYKVIFSTYKHMPNSLISHCIVVLYVLHFQEAHYIA